MRISQICWAAMLVVALAAGTVAPAEAESLTLQTWGGVWEQGARAVGDAFAKKYGVEVNYEQQQNTRMGIAKIRSQKEDPQVDIIFSTSDALEQAAEENLLIAIDPAKAPNLAQLPARAVRATSIDVMNIIFGFAYRKDLAPFELKHWQDLLDPRLAGKVASPNAQFSSGRWIIMASLINGGNENNVDPGFAFLDKLKPNIVSFVATDGESVKVLQSGEAAVLAFGLLSDFAKLLGPDSQLQFVVPDDKPVVATSVGVGIPSSKNADLAVKFLDFISTPEAQTAYCAAITCTPVNPKASAPGAIADFRPAPDSLYRADWHVMNSSLAAWDDRFKKEIQAR